jgi:hypothetical protein
VIVKRSAALGAVALMALVACSGGGGSASYGKAGSSGDDHPLDGDEPSSSTSTTSPTVTTGSSPPTTPSPAPPPNSPTPSNRTDRDDSSGVRLTFVVADALAFDRSDEISFELTVTNTATTTRYASAEQPSQFALTADGANVAAWDDERCTTGIDVDDIPAPVAIEPGESIRFTTTYPYEDRCRVRSGTYFAAGRVEMCPPETLEPTSNGQPVCDRSRNQVLVSSPLRLTIG